MINLGFRKTGTIDRRIEYRLNRDYYIIAAISVFILLDIIITLTLSLLTRMPSYGVVIINAVFLAALAVFVLKLVTFNPLISRYNKLSEALLEAEQKCKSILKTAGNLIVSVNDRGIIIDCNDKIAVMLGYSQKEMIGESILKVIHEDDIEKTRRSFSKHTLDLTLYNQELRMVKRDGSVVDVSVNSSSLKDRKGKFVMAIWIIDDITERKKNEEVLELTKFSIDRGFDAVYWMGPDARFIHVNDAACEALGYTRDELLEMTVHDIDPLFTPDIWAAHWMDIRQKKSFMLETKHRARTGREFPVEVAINYLEYKGKEYNCVFARDISDRKSEELKIRNVNEKLTTSIENLPMAYILWDREFRVREWNKAAEKIFGFVREEVVGKPLLDLIFPVGIRPTIKKILENLSAGKIVGIPSENSNITKSGDIISCYWYNTPLKDKDGKVFGVLSMAEDVTDQLRVRRELDSVNQKFRELTEMLPQTVFELDLNGRVIYANRYGYEFSGYTPEDLEKGIMAMNLFLPEDRRKMRKYMIRVLRGQRIEGTEFIMRKKNGMKANVVIYANPIFGPEGVTGLRGILADITESKRLNEFASRAQRLEIAGRIAGQVAHDFNNLLGPLFAFPEFIRESLPEDDPALTYLEHIEKAAAQMAEINQQLLTLGRRGHYSQLLINLNEVVLQTLERQGPMPKSISVKTILLTDLKHIKGGASQISRMISNLVQNSVDAMNNSGRLIIQTENFHVDRLWSRYGRVPEGDYVKLTISDTGCGITDEAIPHIFDPFFTTKTADSKKGSGLGLSIVQAVMEDHNGYIDVKSRVGRGTSFFLYFPVAGESAEYEESEKIIGGDEKVLVVDDDPLQREVTTNLLKKLGYEISVAESGEKAVEFIKENPQDIILLDMVMKPGIDGAETLKRIMEMYPGQKAIIVSGYADSDRIETALRLGASGFVGKPLSLRSIAKAVRAVIEGKKVNV